jgi:hypothetical protein
MIVCSIQSLQYGARFPHVLESAMLPSPYLRGLLLRQRHGSDDSRDSTSPGNTVRMRREYAVRCKS